METLLTNRGRIHSYRYKRDSGRFFRVEERNPGSSSHLYREKLRAAVKVST